MRTITVVSDILLTLIFLKRGYSCQFLPYTKPVYNMSSNKMCEKGEKRLHDTSLYFPVQKTRWPIIYSTDYNIGFMGFERMHPFDSGKWGRVFSFLKEAEMVRDDTTIQPLEATPEDLMVVHTKGYIDGLRLANIVEGINEWSMTVARITEVPPVAMLPNFLVQRRVLRPLRYQTGGTILAGKLAMERGWAINIGGGFHHCSSERGGGFCAYADITLAIKFAFDRLEGVSKVMIIDLDAHQGNGHERDFMDDDRVYILDMYNRGIYPQDGFAKRAIKRKVELRHFIDDDEYLELVKTHVPGALNEFKPDLIVYNAGTDILDGDPLGNLMITPEGVIERDQIVFENARSRGIPIMMVTSGGYQRSNAKIIADSILNLKKRNLISSEEAENAPLPADSANVGLNKIPKSASEGSGFWSRFRRSTSNCASMTRSQTQEQMKQNPPQSPVDGPEPSQGSTQAQSHGVTQSQDTTQAQSHGVTQSQDTTQAQSHGVTQSQDTTQAQSHGVTQSQDTTQAQSHGVTLSQATTQEVEEGRDVAAGLSVASKKDSRINEDKTPERMEDS